MGSRRGRRGRPPNKPPLGAGVGGGRGVGGVVCRLREAYFAEARCSASRYGLSFERLLVHLWEARRLRRRVLIGSIVYVDDLVHAVACVDDVALAWTDLAERYEAAMIHACRRSLDEPDAVIFVRRLLGDLRRRNRGCGDRGLPSLRGYMAARPLKRWLTDRAVGELNGSHQPLANSNRVGSRVGAGLTPARERHMALKGGRG